MQSSNNDNHNRDSRDDQHNTNENTGHLGQNDQQKMSGRRDDLNDPDFGSEWSSSAPEGNINAQSSRSDNDDFNDSGFDDDRKSGGSFRDDIRSEDSRTFNEDENSWKAKKEMGETHSNRGTENNDWNQTDQMQRSPIRSNSEENRDASSGSYYSEKEEEERRRSDNTGRSNDGDDF